MLSCSAAQHPQGKSLISRMCFLTPTPTGVRGPAQEARPWWPVGAAFRAPAHGEAAQLRAQGGGAGGAGEHNQLVQHH